MSMMTVQQPAAISSCRHDDTYGDLYARYMTGPILLSHGVMGGHHHHPQQSIAEEYFDVEVFC